MRIKDVMSSPVVTVTSYTSIKQAAALLVQHGFNALPPKEDAARAAHLMLRGSLRSIPVTDGGQVVGMVTRRDLLRVLARHDDEIRRELVAALADELPDACVTVTVADGIVTLGFRSWLGPRDRRLAELLARIVPGVLSVRSV